MRSMIYRYKHYLDIKHLYARQLLNLF